MLACLTHPVQALSSDLQAGPILSLGRNIAQMFSNFLGICSKILNVSRNQLFSLKFVHPFCLPTIIQMAPKMGWGNYENSTVGSQIAVGVPAATHGTQETPRAHNMQPNGRQDTPNDTPRLPKMELQCPQTPHIELWRHPKARKWIHTANRRHPNPQMLPWIQKHVSIALKYIDLCHQNYKTLKHISTNVCISVGRPPMFGFKMSACPSSSEWSWPSRFCLGWQRIYRSVKSFTNEAAQLN